MKHRLTVLVLAMGVLVKCATEIRVKRQSYPDYSYHKHGNDDSSEIYQKPKFSDSSRSNKPYSYHSGESRESLYDPSARDPEKASYYPASAKSYEKDSYSYPRKNFAGYKSNKDSRINSNYEPNKDSRSNYDSKSTRSNYGPVKDTRYRYSNKDSRSSYEPSKDFKSGHEPARDSRSSYEPKSSKSTYEPNKETRSSYQTTKASRQSYEDKDYDYDKDVKNPTYESPNRNLKFLENFHPNLFGNSKSDSSSKKSDNSYPSVIDNPRKSSYQSGEVKDKYQRTSFREPEVNKNLNRPTEANVEAKATTSTEEIAHLSPPTIKEVIKKTIIYDDENVDISKEDEKPLTVQRSEKHESKAKTLKRSHDDHHDHDHYKTTPPPIPGVAGVDYPIYATVPMTHFNCSHYKPGYYADPDTMCQVFHICQAGGAMDSFLCPNGTMFNQLYLVCDWWYNVHCGKSRDLYEKSNARLYIVPKTKRDDSKKKEDSTEDDKNTSGSVTRIQAVGYGKNDKSVNSYAYQEVTEGGIGNDNYLYDY